MFALVNVTVSNERQRARMLVGQSVEETHTVGCTEKQGTRTGMYREGTCWKAQGRKKQEEIGIVLFDNKKHLFCLCAGCGHLHIFFIFHDGCSLMNCANGVH